MYDFLVMRYIFWYKDRYDGEWHILMEYEHIKYYYKVMEV